MHIVTNKLLWVGEKIISPNILEVRYNPLQQYPKAQSYWHYGWFNIISKFFNTATIDKQWSYFLCTGEFIFMHLSHKGTITVNQLIQNKVLKQYINANKMVNSYCRNLGNNRIVLVQLNYINFALKISEFFCRYLILQEHNNITKVAICPIHS